MIKLGTSKISKVYFGSNEITKAYLGSTEVYSSAAGAALALAYKTRVIADGGIYENEVCLVAALNNLNSI
jgi:hypothetical protein